MLSGYSRCEERKPGHKVVRGDRSCSDPMAPGATRQELSGLGCGEVAHEQSPTQFLRDVPAGTVGERTYVLGAWRDRGELLDLLLVEDGCKP